MSSLYDHENDSSRTQLFKDRPYADTLEARVRYLRIHEDMTYEEIGDELGYCAVYMRDIWLETEGRGPYWKPSFDDLCENHKQILRISLDTDLTQREIGERVGVNQPTVSKVVNQNEHLIEELR